MVRDNPYGKSKIARRPALNRLSVPSRAWSRLVARGRAGLSDVADGGDRSTLTVPLLRRALAWTRRNEATRQEGAAHEAIHAHRLSDTDSVTDERKRGNFHTLFPSRTHASSSRLHPCPFLAAPSPSLNEQRERLFDIAIRCLERQLDSLDVGESHGLL